MRTVNTTHLVVPAGFHTFQLDLTTGCKVSDKSGFFFTGEDNKAVFSISGDTVGLLQFCYNMTVLQDSCRKHPEGHVHMKCTMGVKQVSGNFSKASHSSGCYDY
jgi:hypothetical protein